MNNGLKQIEALFPILFNIALEKEVRTVTPTVEVFGSRGPKLPFTYTDDIELKRNSVSVIDVVIHLEEEARKKRLRFNKDKTKYMHLTRKKIRDLIRENVRSRGDATQK